MRVRIYNLLLLQPGLHLRAIARQSGAGFGTTMYHLDILLKNNLVRSAKRSGLRRYHAIGPRSEPHRNRLHARRWALRDLRGRVLHAVRRRTPATTSAIARSLGISRQLAAYHLQRLADLGFVMRDGLGFLPRPSR